MTNETINPQLETIYQAESRRVKSLDEAIEWSKRFRKIVGDGESEIVQLFGPDDFA